MSETKYVAGGDPGKSGAIVLVPVGGGELIYFPTPTIANRELDILAIIQFLNDYKDSIVHFAVEEVHAIFGSSAKSTFEFGGAYYSLRTALAAVGIPHTLVQPKKWQAVAWEGVQPIKNPTGRVTKKGNPVMKTDTKATSLLAARRLYPKETFLATPRSKVPHDGLVDAALIAYYAKSLI
jgi:hypothetical protein